MARYKYIPSKCSSYVYVDPYVLKELHEGLRGLREGGRRGEPWGQIDVNTMQAILEVITEENICYCMSSYEVFCKKYCSKILEELKRRGIECSRVDCRDALDPGERLEGIVEVSGEICRAEGKTPEGICGALKVLKRMYEELYEQYGSEGWRRQLCYSVNCEVTLYLSREARCFEYLFLFTERNALCEHCQSISCIAAALCRQENVLLSFHSSRQVDVDRIAGRGYDCRHEHGGVILCRRTQH